MFNRVASFLICSQTDPTCNTTTETSAEIVAASADGLTLIYSDSPKKELGFVDITIPSSPTGLGTVPLAGEPTSVGVVGGYALVAVNTAQDFVNVSGSVQVVQISTQTIVRTIIIGGQPDSVAVSPDQKYVAIAIENERDEDLGDGSPPQLPGGYLVVMDTSSSSPFSWTSSDVALTGLPGILSPTDPECAAAIHANVPRAHLHPLLACDQKLFYH